MFTIKKATTNDIQLINEMAQIVFPATYREILSKEQLDYMMDWMYSPKNLRKQMEEEGHIYYIAYKDGEMHLNVNRNNKALQFYQHLGMEKVAEGDFHIGNGYYMNDYIMGLKI